MTLWIKLNGPAQTKFDEQYKRMLKVSDVTTLDFPPGLFVEYLLDIRAKAQAMKKVSIELEEPNADKDHPHS